MDIDNSRRWWPRLLPLLAATIAVGTDTWVVAGFLPALAADMGVSTATAGLSVTVFAASYALGAPVLAAVTSSARPRVVIAVALLILALANVVCAVSTGFALFLAGRILAALAASVVTPAAGVLAARVADERYRGRALALVIAGLTIATALGVPVGHVLAATTSWRGALFAIAGLALVAAILIHTTAPNPPAGSPHRIADRLVPLTEPRALSILALTVLGMAAAYVPYAYIAKLSPDGHSGWFVAILTAYGIGAVVGSLTSGSLTDILGPTRTLTIAYALMAAAFLAMAVGPPAIVLVLAAAIWGAASWAQTPPQQHRLLDAMPTIGSVAIGTNASALYVGIALGNSLGALVFDAGTAVMCLVAAAGALAALLWNRTMSPTARHSEVAR
ncbi:MFS transporter [Nocardia sp. GTS18]|uniref:MFS transporter n=1 Tax=Nocardia sp. GTS18 TaxID=1778064 RepID=UPI0015EEB00F|nr:MFS transporter [Nocardia sp. GTS18]